MADASKIALTGLSVAAKLGEPVMRHAMRLYRERQASRVTSSIESDLLIKSFDETLARLAETVTDQSWWRTLLNVIEQPFVAPDFLRIPSLQSWLSNATVREDLKAEARDQLLNIQIRDPERQMRLSEVYAEVAGERKELANGPINVVVNILIAGYLASLSPQIKSAVAFIQASDAVTRDNLSRLEEKLDAALTRTLDETVIKVHTDQASEKLKLILVCRSFRPEKSREDIRALLHQITDGNLRHADFAVRTQVLYWTVRLHSTTRDTVKMAEQLLVQLKSNQPEFDCRIPEALICETNGEVEKALALIAPLNDPDGRATAFRLVRSARGASTAVDWYLEQDDRETPAFLSPLGWFNVIVTFCEVRRWSDAASISARVESLWIDWPDLAFLDGVINAAMLLPDELRHHALKMNLFHSAIRPRYGVTETAARMRAMSSFRRASELLEPLGEDGKLRSEVARDWVLWLQLSDPDSEIANSARKEITEAMKSTKRAIHLLPFAHQFEIPYDAERVRRYLSHRSRLGALDDSELGAELMLAKHTLNKEEFATFLEREEERFSRVFPRATIVGMLVEALLDTSQAAKADELLDKNNSLFSADDVKRLRALIALRKGEDPRVELERLYENTHSLLDLSNLVQHLTRINHWPVVCPLMEELFRIERNPENAMRLIRCYKNVGSLGARRIAEFFKNETDVETWSHNLAAEHAWALFEVGQLQQARGILDRLLNARRDLNDTNLDINIAIKSGYWERLSAIVDREWKHRDNLDPEFLLRLATISAEADSTAHRSVELAKLAVTKAPEEPKILLSAYVLLSQVDREEECDPDWLVRAVEHSDEAGPIQKVSLRAVAEELIPASRKRAAYINEKLRKAEVPIHVAARILNMPLSRLLINLPERNLQLVDGRQRVLIPAFSGARRPQAIPGQATIGIDMTSIMVLGWLGVFEEALSGNDRLLIPASTMIMLLNERRRVRFHQPSLVRRAQHIRHLIDSNRLKVAEERIAPPRWLVDEVGSEFAELLEAARTQNTTLVHGSTIYRAGAYLEESATLGTYESLVCPLQECLEAMHSDGRISTSDLEKGTSVLRALEAAPPTVDNVRPCQSTYLIDDLALTYLSYGGILEPILRSGITLYVHHSTKSDQEALLTASREGEQLADKLDDIRVTLRDLLTRDQIGFLPDARFQENDYDTDTLSELCINAQDCDILCVDDRFANTFHLFSDDSGRPHPVICSCDLLESLVARGRMSSSKLTALESRLRLGGFTAIPLNENEMFRLLRNTKLDASGNLTESAELRNVRQYLGLFRSADLLQIPKEGPFLERLLQTSIQLVRRLWEDTTISTERLEALSDWIVRYIWPNPVEWVPHLREAARAEQTTTMIASCLKLLVSPLISITSERNRSYVEWLDNEILTPLRPSNPRLIQLISELCKTQIEQLNNAIDSDENYEP